MYSVSGGTCAFSAQRVLTHICRLRKEVFCIKKQTDENKTVTDLRHLIVTSAELYGDKPRYIFKGKKTRKGVNFSVNDVLREMNSAGTAFSALDLMGKTVAVIGDTHPLYVVTYYAVVNGNGIIVPLDKEINDDELVNFLIRSHAEAVVYTESQNTRMAAIADRVDGVRYFIPITPADSDEGRDRVISWEALQSRH